MEILVSSKRRDVEEDILKLARLFKESGALTILDLGCGPGKHTSHFAENEFDSRSFSQSIDLVSAS